MDAHERRVNSIASRVQDFYQRQQPFRIHHGSTNSTRPSDRQRNRMVDTSGLNHVIDVDVDARFILAEPNVPMDALVEATMPHGMIPPVVMEFPGITAGGGFCGTSAESSSFRYGFFDRTVSWIEMVLANGTVVAASQDENSDLFYGAASSFGTLGVTTLLRIDLIPAKKFVELTYNPVSGIEDAVSMIQRAATDPRNDFIDGIMFSKTSGVICIGSLTDGDSRAPVQRFTKSTDPWFYLHAEDMLRRGQRGQKTTECVPLRDYLFRYDRGAFWMGRYAYKYFLTPFNRVTRWALDYFMHTRVMYHALHKSGQMKHYIIQDVAVPYPAATDFSEYIHDSFGCYPIWLCPLDNSRQESAAQRDNLLREEIKALPKLLINFGVWCSGPSNRHEFVRINRDLEQKVHSLKGRKWLYALTYNTEEEFWSLYDRTEYDALRKKYHASYLPTVFDKVKVDVDAEESVLRESYTARLLSLFWSIWPLSGFYGIYKAALGGDYLVSSESTSKGLFLVRSILVICLGLLIKLLVTM